MALYWINGQGEYRQFVSNRDAMIKKQPHVQWHHVPTEDNPADLGSRGGKCVDSKLWRNVPHWLSDYGKWPPNVILEPNEDTRAETKVIRNVFTTTTVETRVQDQFDELLKAHALNKVLRIGAWARRFIENCRRTARDREYGPINTAETESQRSWWIKRAQNDAANDDEVKKDEVNLNLQLNHIAILECRGRMVGSKDG